MFKQIDGRDAIGIPWLKKFPNLNNHRFFQNDGAFGAHFLATIAFDAFAVIVHGGFGFIPVQPVHGFAFNRATLYAGSALGAFIDQNKGFCN